MCFSVLGINTKKATFLEIEYIKNLSEKVFKDMAMA